MNGGLFGTKYDWQYNTENNGKTNQANVNGTVNWPRGKMLGGCSSINAMIYIRGNDHDYKEWYNEGNLEWHPSIVRRYFKKAESFQNYKFLDNREIYNFYGKSGPQVVNRFNSTFRDVTERVVDSWDAIGFKKVPDINTANSLGSGILTVTAQNGRRISTAAAYLNPIRNRKNLKVMKNTLVTKILINDVSKVAFGVEVNRNGKKMVLYSRLEVILSAGVVNTPQLLMLSGVGPTEHLNAKTIPCKVDLPAVGQNLQDHLMIPVTIYGNEPGEENEAQQHFDEIRYLYDRTGYLAQNSIADITALYSSCDNGSYPLFQSHLFLLRKRSPDTRHWAEIVANYKTEVIDSMVNQNNYGSLYLFLFNLLHPYSRGKILLRSKNPEEPPLIYANYFDDPRDLKASVKGIKMLTKIVNTPYFKSIGGYLGRLKWPACDKYEIDSDEYWECICINMVITIYHPAGTAKMGLNPNTSVVDSRLRVHRMKRLRVIDASVMPTLTSGNTNAPVIMVGERGADLIKVDYNIK